MDFGSSLSSLFITIVLGAFIGLQFQKNAEEKHFSPFAGLRTCMGISLLGYLTAFLNPFNESYGILITSFFLLLVLISYVQSSWQEKRLGATGEISLVILFLIGVLVGIDEINIAIIITILLSIISTAREELYQFGSRFSKFEIIETVKFAIIVFMILPLLPNRTIDPWGVINPQQVWLLVILISGISFLGYMASKFIGRRRGILLSGFIGGAVSSTAVTTTMAIQNKRQPKITLPYTLAIMLASMMMYIRVLVEVFVINPALLNRLIIPIGGMILTMLTFSFWIYYQKTHQKQPKLKQEIKLETPFSLKPAIKFSIFFVVILLVIEFSNTYLGAQGVYLTALVSGLADVDAIALSLSNLSLEKTIAESLAIQAITTAVIANTMIKVVYVHLFGNSALRKRVFWSSLVTSLVGIGLVFMV